MNVKRVVALRRMTHAVSNARQTEMARLRLEETRLREQLVEIESARSMSLANLDPETPAARSGAIMVWQAWVDGRKSTINSELAKLRARMIAARTDLAHAYGRDRALSEVTDQLASREALLAQRRKDNRGE